MRRIFSTVFGPHEPALTVGSLAISATGRPADRAPCRSRRRRRRGPSCSQLASSASSANESGVDEPRDALAHRQLALLRRPSRGGAPGRRRSARSSASRERSVVRMVALRGVSALGSAIHRDRLLARVVVEAAARLSGRTSPRRPSCAASAARAKRRSRYSSNITSPIERDACRGPTKSSSVSGPIGWAAPRLHRGVDLLDRADALLVGADRVEHVGHEQPVDDEAGLVLGVHDRSSPSVSPNSKPVSSGLVGGRDRLAPPRAAASPARG